MQMTEPVPPSRSKWRTEYGLLTSVILGIAFGYAIGNWKLGLGIGLGVGLLWQVGSMSKG